MSGIQQMLLSGAGGYAVDAADFDGVNDGLWNNAATPQATDSTQVIVSAWLRIDGGDLSTRIIWDDGTSAGFEVFLTGTNVLRIAGREVGTNTEKLRIDSTNTLAASAVWRHILFSADLAATPVAHLYIDDVNVKDQITLVAATIDFSRAQVRVGESLSGTSRFNGCMAEFYYAPNQYLDFSVEANRRKFRTALGKPVFLGADGSLPTGTAPYMFLRVPKGGAASTFSTNRGTGTALSTVGSLDLASTSPSD